MRHLVTKNPTLVLLQRLMSLGANYSGEMNKVQNGSVQAEQHHRVPEMAVLRGCFITIIGTKFTGNVCTRYVSACVHVQ